MTIVSKPLISALDVAMSSDGFAIAYAAPNDDDGAPHIFVKAIKR